MIAAPAVSGLLDRLRAETRERHAALDTSLRIDSPAAYAAFLRASYAAVALVEPQLARIGFVVERAPAIAADLAALGAALPAGAEPPPTASDDAAFGAAYVLEGSTLGGLHVAQTVEALGITATRYLRLRGKLTAARWRAFLADLDRSGADADAACAAAAATFDHYARCFRASGSVGARA